MNSFIIMVIDQEHSGVKKFERAPWVDLLAFIDKESLLVLAPKLFRDTQPAYFRVLTHRDYVNYRAVNSDFWLDPLDKLIGVTLYYETESQVAFVIFSA